MRLLRILRTIVGLALLGWSAWTILRPVVRHAPPAVVYGVDAGEPTGLRISPLAPAETAAAAALEEQLVRDWIAADRQG